MKIALWDKLLNTFVRWKTGLEKSLILKYDACSDEADLFGQDIMEHFEQNINSEWLYGIDLSLLFV